MVNLHNETRIMVKFIVFLVGGSGSQFCVLIAYWINCTDEHIVGVRIGRNAVLLHGGMETATKCA